MAQGGGGDIKGGATGDAGALAQAGGGGTAAGTSVGGGTAGGSSGQAGGGASAGQGGGGAAGAGQGGSGGGSGEGGSAGLGQAGGSPVCRARPPQPCTGGPITLAKTCVPEALATAGTSLPLDRCQALCEAAFKTFSCSVSAVDQTSITVQCATGCPTTQ